MHWEITHVQRIAAIFTCLVFSILIGGLLSRNGAVPKARLGDFEPVSTPVLPALVDPLGAIDDATTERKDRLVLRVVDGAAQPIPGAALVVRGGVSVIWAFTKADGTAALDGLSPGKSRLAVIAFPHPGLELDIEPGSEVRQIELQPPATLPQGLHDIPRSRCAGGLAWAGPESAAGYELLLLPVARASEFGGTLPRSSVCDESGKFALEGLAHGRYLVRILPPWASGGSWPDLAAASSHELDFKGESSELTLELARGRIEGEVRDDLGRALEGALVLMNEIANESHVWPPCSTGPDGRFLFQDVPPGKYRVSCRAGEGSSAIEELSVEAGSTVWAALPAFAARKRP